LLPVRALMKLFRGKYLAGLKRLHAEGELKLEGKLSGLADRARFERWLSRLYRRRWQVYCQAPISSRDGAESVLKYLARYVAGVAISDRRLVSQDAGGVRFLWKDYAADGVERPMSLPGVEFVRRYLMHVVPKRFRRIRYYGMWSNQRRGEDLARCRALLGVSSAATDGAAGAAAKPVGAMSESAAPPAEKLTAPAPVPCPQCAMPMELYAMGRRPNWPELLGMLGLLLCALLPGWTGGTAAPHTGLSQPLAACRDERSPYAGLGSVAWWPAPRVGRASASAWYSTVAEWRSPSLAQASRARPWKDGLCGAWSRDGSARGTRAAGSDFRAGQRSRPPASSWDTS